MNILLSTDDNYVMPTGVLMHSISINNGSDVHYYILIDKNFSDSSMSSLTEIAEHYNNKISFYTITPEMTNELPFGRENQPKGVTIATYYRLFISEILPRDVHKIIYLDGDMIVRKSLAELWKVDMSNVALGAVRDSDEQCHLQRMPYPEEKGYFNAGMLLINLDYWREHRCFNNFMKCAQDHNDSIVMHDQDILNITFSDHKLWLPMKYNFQTSYVLNPSWYECIERDKEEAKRTMINPTIIHYASHDKPWKITCYHPHTAVWRYYWRMSEWKNDKLIGENPHSLIERIRLFALRHNLYMPKCQYQRCILKR